MAYIMASKARAVPGGSVDGSTRFNYLALKAFYRIHATVCAAMASRRTCTKCTSAAMSSLEIGLGCTLRNRSIPRMAMGTDTHVKATGTDDDSADKQ